MSNRQKGSLAAGQEALDALRTIKETDDALKAWVYTPDDGELAISAGAEQGPLAGMPFGVKDIINVAGMPTRCGSPSYESVPAQFDAACVSLLRAAGAVPVGKTATAEFAHVSPAQTRNPHNPEHTPGGSSSGSAASVAAGMVRFALGTQTGGSVIRPSAFCGVVGFKPTFGAVHRDGVKMTCDSLDTIGWHARTVDDAALVGQVLLTQPQVTEGISDISTLKVAYMPRIPDQDPDPDAAEVFEQAKRALQDKGVQVEDIGALPLFSTLLEAHHVIMTYEFARSLAPVARLHADVLTKPLLDAVELGLKIPTSQYIDRKQLQAESRGHWQKYFADADLILSPGAIGTAPKGLHSTGSSIFNRYWTLLGWPCLQLPVTKAANGLPLGVQFIGKPNTDMHLLAWGKLLHECIGNSRTA